MQEYFEIGQIVNTFGVKGMVKVVPYTDDITRFNNLKDVYIIKKNKSEKYDIEEVEYHKNMVLIKFKNINSIDEAEVLRNSILKVARKDAIPLEEGSYYIADLIGANVYTDEGKLIGVLQDIYNTGSNDIYVVKDELGKQTLLPAIKDVIKEISLEENKIIVHILNGLI